MINETAMIDEDLFTGKINETSSEKKEVVNKKSPKLDLPKSSNSAVATVDKMVLKIAQISIGQQNFEINSDGIAKLVKKIQESLKNNDQKTLKDIGIALENLNNINFLFVILKDLLGSNSKEEQICVQKTLANLTKQTQAKIFRYAQENQDTLLTIENIFSNFTEIDNENIEAIKIEIAKLKISDKSGTLALGGNGFVLEKDILMLDNLLAQLDPTADTAMILDKLFQQDGQKYRFSENFIQKLQLTSLNEDAKKLMMIYQISENKIYLSEDELNQPPTKAKIDLIAKYIQVTGNIFILDNLPKYWQEAVENKINHCDFTEKNLVNLLLKNKGLTELSDQAKKNNEGLLGNFIGTLDFFKKTPYIGNYFTNINLPGTLLKTRKTIYDFYFPLVDFKKSFFLFKNNILKTLGKNPELKEILHNIEDLVTRIEKAEQEFAVGIIDQNVFEGRIEYVINQLNIINQKILDNKDKGSQKLAHAFITVRDTVEKNNLKINSLAFQILNDFLKNNNQDILSQEFAVQNNFSKITPEPTKVQEKISTILNEFIQRNDLSQVLKVIQADILHKQEVAEKLLRERLEFDKQIENKIKKNKEALATMEKIIQITTELQQQINKTKLVGLIVNIENFIHLIDKQNDLPEELTNLIKELEELKIKMRERFPEIFK